MSSIDVTIRKNCVVGWKCPACGCVAAAKTCWVEWGIQSLDSRDNPADVELEIAGKLNQTMKNPCLDYGALFAKMKEQEAATGKDCSSLLRTMKFDTVRCPRCRRRPTWSRHRGGDMLVGGIAMVLIAVMMFWLALVLRLDITDGSAWMPVEFFVAGVLWVGGSVGVVELYHAFMNMHSCAATESAHMPLVAYGSFYTKDENDPRSVAVFRFIAEHPGLIFRQTQRRHISIDAD